MSKFRRFTKDEERFLTENYTRLGPARIATAVGKTMKAVSKKARKMGLERGVARSNVDRRNAWSFQEWTYELGYLVGVYLGDGTAHVDRKSSECGYFRLSVVDLDFAQATAAAIEHVTKFRPTIRRIAARPPGRRPMYRLTFSNRDFARWLVLNFGPPGQKRITPLGSSSANAGLVQGLFDSEGTSQKYTVAIRMWSDLSELPKAFASFSTNPQVNFSVWRGQLSTSGSPMNRISMSVAEWKRMGLGTHARRKAKNGVPFKSLCWGLGDQATELNAA